MSDLVLRTVDAALDQDPRIAKVIADLDLKEIDWSNPLPHAMKVSAYIQKEYADLVGKDKMDLLTQVLKEVIARSEISEEERSTALRFVENVLPIAVSAAVMVAKGEVDWKAKAREIAENPAEAVEMVQAVAMPYCMACWGRVSTLSLPRAQTPKDLQTTNPMHTKSA
jgi:hypothetical protein